MKKIILGIITVLVLLVVIVLVKTYTYPFKKVNVSANSAMNIPQNDSAIYRFSGGLKIPTISTGELGDFDYTSFDQFKKYLKETYPLIYQHTEYHK